MTSVDEQLFLVALGSCRSDPDQDPSPRGKRPQEQSNKLLFKGDVCMRSARGTGDEAVQSIVPFKRTKERPVDPRAERGKMELLYHQPICISIILPGIK